MAVAPALTHSFRAPGRLPGVDLARGLAVLGMLAAHLVALPDWSWSDPGTWTAVAAGRSSILFAVLAGVSIALVTGGPSPLPRGPLLARARWSLAVRGALLWVIGLALIATGVPVSVILPAYGVLFVLAVPLLRLGARALWLLAAVLAALMPWVQPALDALPVRATPWGDSLALALGWRYPFPVWIAFVVAGMAAGRSGLAAPRAQRVLLVGGVALVVGGYGADAVLGMDPQGSYLSAVLTARPHSSGLWEVIGSGGFALASIALCQLACRVRRVATLALPLRAVGSMPLTAYVGQLVAWAIVAAVVLGDTGDLVGMRELGLFWAFALATIAFCTVWALLWGRGPLERTLAWLTRRLRPA